MAMASAVRSIVPHTLVIGCGALARELLALTADLPGVRVVAVDARLHNRPERIAAAVKRRIARARREHGDDIRLFVAYADCGTGGALDAMLADEGVERLPGEHCFELYAGAKAYAALQDAEIGTFYLTDFLARQFDTLVIEGLGIDRHPELLPMYFGNYTKLIFLQQVENPALAAKAKAAADRLGLAFEHRFTGYGELRDAIEGAAASVAAPPRRVAGQRG